MAMLKCKMCGGELKIAEGSCTAQCEYCGTVQTVPHLDNEKKLSLFQRAHRLRSSCDFDKAAGIYESILTDFPDEAEAYWGLVLCKYGIEYVTDPATGKKVPTCHRSSFDSVMDDSNFEQVMETADVVAVRLYREEAKQIEALRKSILEVSVREEPYDIFICYKETDPQGQRTLDSVLGQAMYDALTKMEYRVFFSRISLEDKLGQSYEPYIFAALNSAKLMLVIGSSYENLSAVWVKNEWSRFLQLMNQDSSRHLIPCYRDIDAYDMPREFSHLQAQDMGKVGAMQDLLRGVEKLLPRHRPDPVPLQPAQSLAPPATAALLERAYLFLEDGKWQEADQYCEKVLDMEPRNGYAYLGKLMAQLKVRRQGELSQQSAPFDHLDNYQKALRFGNESLCRALPAYNAHIRQRNEEARVQGIYQEACRMTEQANTEKTWQKAIDLFASIPGFRDADALAEKCREKLQLLRYDNACSIYRAAEERKEYQKALDLFLSLGDYREAPKKAQTCREKLEKIKKMEEAEKAESKAFRKTMLIFLGICAAAISVVFLFSKFILPAINYGKAEKLMENGDYARAAIAYGKLGDYRDAHSFSLDCWDKALTRRTFDLGRSTVVAIQEDGTVIATGVDDEKLAEIATWKNISTVATGGSYILGLRKDGTVVNAGAYMDEMEDSVRELKNVVDLDVDGADITALLTDGTHITILGNTKSSTGGNCTTSYYHTENLIQATSHAGLTVDGTLVSRHLPMTQEAVAFASNENYTAYVRKDGTVVTSCESWDVSGWTDIVSVAIGLNHLVGLRSDGTVVATGNNTRGQCFVSQWRNIVAIDADDYQTAGLTADGKIVMAGKGSTIGCDVENWTDIRQLSAGEGTTMGLDKNGNLFAAGCYSYFSWNPTDYTNAAQLLCGDDYLYGLMPNGTVLAQGSLSGVVKDWTDIRLLRASNDSSTYAGIRSNGTVVLAGYDSDDYDVSLWKNIVDVAIGNTHIVGLKADGTVLALGENNQGQCIVSDWTDIVAVAAGKDFTVGLKKDGTLVATGSNYQNQCDISSYHWQNMTAIACGLEFTAGLRDDGTVFVVGGDSSLHAARNWKDIVAICAGSSHLVGLKKDGTVVSAGNAGEPSVDLSQITGVRLPALGGNP